MIEFCTICGHPRGEQAPTHGETCGCGCHHGIVDLVHRASADFQAIAGVRDGAELEGDNWPVVSCERNPGGFMGIKVTFPGSQLGVDELAFNIEPQRAQRLRDSLTAHLKMVGIE